MDKVKLPKNIFDILDKYKNGFVAGHNWMVLAEIFRAEESDRKISHDDYLLISFAKDSEQNFENLLQALVNGYEVEETPEDKVREYYHNVADYDPPRTAVKRVLNLLNIKIVGVNHE